MEDSLQSSRSVGGLSGPEENQLGRYRVAGRLATGGMAEILLGKLLGPSGFQRPVVIKRILPQLAQQPEFVEMFLDEARIAARIHHPNVIQVQELGQDGDHLFQVMEYLEGESAAGLMRRLVSGGRQLDFGLCAFIIAEACAGLDAAHRLTDDDGAAMGLVHRDISPDNIFVTYDAGIKVLDFGIAKASDRITQTQIGQKKGKFSYMSPEQCNGERLDERSDLFSLGVVLYELSVGRRLFRRANEMLVMRAVCEDPIPVPSKQRESYPHALERICLRAIERDVALRYQSASEMRNDLVAFLRGLGGAERYEVELKKLMRDLFGDRIAEKREMLRRVSTGAVLTHVPAAEVDAAVELPGDAIPFDLAETSANVRVKRRPAAKRRGRWMVAGAVIVVGVMATWAFVARSSAPARVAVAAPPTPRVAPPVAAPPAPPAMVQMTFMSTPAGASVSLDGVEQGVTPLHLSLPRDRRAIIVELKHDGYAPQSIPLRPESDQIVQLALTKVAPATKRSSNRATSSTNNGFHRFD